MLAYLVKHLYQHREPGKCLNSASKMFFHSSWLSNTWCSSKKLKKCRCVGWPAWWCLMDYQMSANLIRTLCLIFIHHWVCTGASYETKLPSRTRISGEATFWSAVCCFLSLQQISFEQKTWTSIWPEKGYYNLVYMSDCVFGYRGEPNTPLVGEAYTDDATSELHEQVHPSFFLSP